MEGPTLLMDCIKKNCKNTNHKTLARYMRKFQGQWREFYRYHCEKCNSVWSAAGAVVDKKVWLEKEQSRFARFLKKQK